nr:hypothetical protein CFP56_17439 [Quercus suber]
MTSVAFNTVATWIQHVIVLQSIGFSNLTKDLRTEFFRPANEWSVDETVEPAKDQEIHTLVWVMGSHWLIRGQTSTSLRTVKSNMPSSMAHLTNGANRTLMRATIASFVVAASVSGSIPVTSP